MSFLRAEGPGAEGARRAHLGVLGASHLELPCVRGHGPLDPETKSRWQLPARAQRGSGLGTGQSRSGKPLGSSAQASLSRTAVNWRRSDKSSVVFLPGPAEIAIGPRRV